MEGRKRRTDKSIGEEIAISQVWIHKQSGELWSVYQVFRGNRYALMQGPWTERRVVPFSQLRKYWEHVQ